LKYSKSSVQTQFAGKCRDFFRFNAKAIGLILVKRANGSNLFGENSRTTTTKDLTATVELDRAYRGGILAWE